MEYDDGVAQHGDARPAIKRKLSRLNHMTISKVAADQAGELMHKGFDTEANRGSPARVDQRSPLKSMGLADGRDDAEANKDNLAGTTTASPSSQQEQHHVQVKDGQSPLPAQLTADPISSEMPSVTGAADALLPNGVSLAAGSEDVQQDAVEPRQPFHVNLDDEDDDDWEDQPAGLNIEAEEEDDSIMESAQPVAGPAATEDSLEAAHDPTHRRRNLYDDEDEWEEIVLKEKRGGGEVVSDVQLEEEDEIQQSKSASGSDVGPADDEDILAEDADAANAATQRLLRETVTRDVLGKGFKPEVAPVNNLLARLAARQTALEAKAKQRVIQIDAADEQQPGLTLEQLKAHLQQHSIGGKQQSKLAGVEAHTADPMAVDDPDEDAAVAMDDVGDGNDDDADVDDVELEVEPAKQPQGTTAAGMLPPDTQLLCNELPSLPLRHTTGVFADFPASLGSAPELELRLGDDARATDEQQAHLCGTEAPMAHAAAANTSDTCGQQGEEAASGSEEEGEADLDSSEVDSLASEGEEEAESDSLAEPEKSDSLAEPEPLHWEEEEEVAAGPNSSEQREDNVAEEDGEAGDGAKGKSSKVSSKVRQYRAAGGFIEAEADLSDEDGHLGGGESDDEDMEDDEMLAELIAEVKEGRLDESRRADLHAKWMAGKDAKEMTELLEALKRGFRRKRKAGAGLDDDEDDGTDAAARRRRAQLLGTLDDDDEEDNTEAAGTDRFKRLDFVWKEEEADLQAATAALAAELANRDKQKRIQELQQNSEAQDGGDVVQLLQMDMIDEDSQHTVALLSRSDSATTAANTFNSAASAALQFGAGLSRAPSSKLKHQTGPGREPSAVGDTSDAAAGGFTFQMFGKDLTNSSRQIGAKHQQVAGSFIGRQASSSVTVRAASNYGASRSFVFGSDPSNHSNPGVNKEQQGGSKTAVGPASFAGLGKLIADAALKGLGPSRLGTGSGGQSSALLQMLGSKKGAGVAAVSGSAKLHMDAVEAKFKAVGESRGPNNSNAATSRGGQWQF